MPLPLATIVLSRSIRSHVRLAAKAISERLRLEIEGFDDPRVREKAGADPAAAAAARSGERQLVVLVVDDDADMRTYVAQSIRALNVPADRILEAADGAEALVWLAAMAVDLVITDVVMPEVDGIDLCARLHGDPVLRDVPILLVSGEAGADDILRRTPPGAPVTFLEKPFNARSLHDAIVEALR